jgi:hypothetical protein
MASQNKLLKKPVELPADKLFLYAGDLFSQLYRLKILQVNIVHKEHLL